MLVNEYRTQNGLGTVVLNVDLNEAADWYVTDMSSKNYFGSSSYCAGLNPPKPAHCDSYGGGPAQRVSAFGYGPASVGENAAAGFSSAQAVFNAWKGSSGHNTNMLRSYWQAVGIGRACQQGTQYGCYWVTDFGSVDSEPKPNKPYPGVLFTPTPTPVPATPSPTPVPTPAPTPWGLTWGSFSCEGPIVPQDAVSLLMNDAGIPVSAPAGNSTCPSVGQAVYAGGAYWLWGDIDCSAAINAVDSVKLLLWLIGTPVAALDPECPSPGDPF
jgi:hypothetical protein